MAPQKSPRNMSANSPRFLLFFALLWTGFSSIFVIIGLVQGELMFSLFGGLFMAVGLAVLFWALLSYYTRFRVGRPEFTISSTTLRVGESFDVSYMHSFKTAVHVEHILVQLIFRETATYQRGTDTKTVIHNEIIDEFEQPGGRYQRGALIQESLQLQIPPDSMHTLKVQHNKLQWFVKFQLAVPKLPDFVEEYELDVAPEMAKAKAW